MAHSPDADLASPPNTQSTPRTTSPVDDGVRPSGPTGTVGEATDSPTAGQETREERIRLAAYAAAERRGFAPGFELDDWYLAEREVDADRGPDAASTAP